LQWWDATISRTHCDEKRINSTKERMVHQHHHTGVEKVRHEFAKQMGAQFHVRKVKLMGIFIKYRKLFCLNYFIVILIFINLIIFDPSSNYGPEN